MIESISNAIDYRISPPVENAALNALFNAAWGGRGAKDFKAQFQHSLLYICAYAWATELVGFVNVAWDGGIHAFLVDTTVHPAWQRCGVGRKLVLHAVAAARREGVHWLHVDYEPQYESFYRECGFTPTLAGLIRLAESD
ncbi:MAG: N-acetyltransferase [Chloroflexota bacterium]|nr:GNAT family N-acetyltransferase [Caldilinea sp.]GIK71510.1 MAG: N-acetyltransferase [Chloroflexota bacterium]